MAGKPLDELEREIAQTRQHAAETFDEIVEQMAPQNLMNGAVSYLRRNEAAGDFFHNLRAGIAANPFPLLLAGVALGWMMFETTRYASATEAARRAQARRRMSLRPRGAPGPISHHEHVEDGRGAPAGTAPAPAPAAETVVASDPAGKSAEQSAEVFGFRGRSPRVEPTLDDLAAAAGQKPGPRS
jgi:Protein of unknown function (DUF3618)